MIRYIAVLVPSVLATTDDPFDFSTVEETTRAPYETPPFFDLSEWDSSQECYDEFMYAHDGNTYEFAECCNEHPSSMNCAHYRPDDPCWNTVEAGECSLDAGWFGYYPTSAWQDCCWNTCTDNGWDCQLSYYCRSMQSQSDDIWVAYSWYILSALSFLSIMSCLCIACCFCGSCTFCAFGRKTSNGHKQHSEAAQQKQRYVPAPAPNFIANDRYQVDDSRRQVVYVNHTGLAAPEVSGAPGLPVGNLDPFTLSNSTSEVYVPVPVPPATTPPTKVVEVSDSSSICSADEVDGHWA